MTAWRVRLGDAAEADFASILNYTANKFGVNQARIYQTTLTQALAALHSGPDVLGSVVRSEILPSLRSLHIARNGRRGRHFIIYRPVPEQVIEVVRILHDAMDLAQHITPDALP